MSEKECKRTWVFAFGHDVSIDLSEDYFVKRSWGVFRVNKRSLYTSLVNENRLQQYETINNGFQLEDGVMDSQRGENKDDSKTETGRSWT